MKRSAAAWSLAGIVAGCAGLATSYLVAQLMNLRLNPVDAVAEMVRDATPSGVVNWARDTLGTASKPVTVISILLIMAVVFGVLGVLGRRAWWLPVVGFGLLALVGGVAVMTANGAMVSDLLPVAVGFVTWTVALSLLVERLRRLHELPEKDRYGERWRGRRRDFLVIVGSIVGVGAVAGVAARFAGRGRRETEQARRLLKLPVSAPVVPDGARMGVDGTAPWMTPVDDFYLIDTAFAKPAILPKDWQLRIHGMVENEIVLTYDDLVNRELTEGWITLNCVSNPVGGDLIGNAWWSGVLLAPLLAEARPTSGADAVLQTSEDGWTCGTPLEALTDDRQAMLALSMNGEPLTIEHGFPVRTVVPGLYGYVSATKWVVDMEVSTFADVDAYWTQNGWGELGPVKMSSRIEVPGSGADLPSGRVVIAGSAWSQHTGIAAVEVQVDGGPWTQAELGAVPSDDTWVQWKATVDLDAGDHLALVRATDAYGLVQTSAVADVLPDGATGWHEVEFTTS